MSFETFLLSMYLLVGLGFAVLTLSLPQFKTEPIRTTLYSFVLLVAWGVLVPAALLDDLFGGDDEADLQTHFETDDDERSQSH